MRFWQRSNSDWPHDKFQRISVGIAAKERIAPGSALGVSDACCIEPRGYPLDAVDEQCYMPVAAAVLGKPMRTIGTRKLQQVNLLPPHMQPGAGETQVRAQGIYCQAQYTLVESK